jgi:hypothetical protein
VERLLEACSVGKASFFAHSTLAEHIGPIVEGFFGVRCAAALQLPDLLRQLGVAPAVGGAGLPSVVSRRDFISLGWLARCCCILHKKASEVLGDTELLVIHDNLPFNREGDTAVIQLLTSVVSSQRVRFMTAGTVIDFPPADNLAAAANACMNHTDGTIDQWVLRHGRPSNVYITMDEPNGTFVRYL